MTSISDVLKASKGLHVDDIFAELWGRKLASDYTIATYTGTLPAVLTGTKAGYLHRYKIYGNLSQNGTPTPENPIVPSECGERTANLFDKNTVLAGYRFGSDGNLFSDRGYSASEFISISPNTSYYRNYTFNINECICFYDENKSFIERYTTSSNVVTSPVNAYYARISIRNERVDTTMLNSGSTALPYEPYGYKLPLASAGQSADIYLGESQTTRQIGKFDLSQATWSSTGTPGLLRTTDIPNIKYTSSNLELGNGLAEKYQIHTGSGMSTAVNCIAIDTAQVSVNTGSNSIKPTGIFYYALATPETAVLNEPLRKIGNYADTIDSTQTSAQIPTLDNSTTISWAGSGLAPSQVELEYERK